MLFGPHSREQSFYSLGQRMKGSALEPLNKGEKTGTFIGRPETKPNGLCPFTPISIGLGAGPGLPLDPDRLSPHSSLSCTLKCIFLYKRLRETIASGRRETGGGIHATYNREICTSEYSARREFQLFCERALPHSQRLSLVAQ